MSATSSRPRLGVITIGQAPRNDVMPQMLPFLPKSLDIRQVGALDGLTDEEVNGLAPHPTDYVLHTRLRNGSPVTIGREAVRPLVQTRIEELDMDGVNPILLLCTGEFPELHSRGMLIEPDRLLVNIVRGLGARRIAVFVPLASQVGALTDRWGSPGVVTSFVSASPYTELGEVTDAARKLQAQALDVVIMDCMGYTRQHKQAVGEITGRPVVLASSMIARVVGELVDSL